MVTISTYLGKWKEMLCWAMMLQSILSTTQAQDLGPSARALGGVSTVLVDPWTGWNNPSALALERTVQASFEAHNRFFIPALTEGSAAIHAPLAKGGIGAGFRRYGLGQFQEYLFNIAYGRALGTSMTIGSSLNYQRLSQGDAYPAQGSLSMNLGMLFLPNKDWVVGIHLINPFRSRWSNHLDEVQAMSLELGASKCFGDQLTAYAELEKAMDQALVVACGMAYVFAPHFTVRTGIRTVDRSWRLGMSYDRKAVVLEVTQAWSQVLGLSSAIGCSFQLVRPSDLEG